MPSISRRSLGDGQAQPSQLAFQKRVLTIQTKKLGLLSNKSVRLKVVFWAVLGAFFLSTLGAIAKSLNGFSPFFLILSRCSFGLLLLVPSLLRNGTWKRLLDRKPLKSLLLRGVCVMGNLLGAYACYTSSLDLGVSVALVMTGPLFAAVLSIFLVKERLLWSQWLAIAAGYAGVLIIKFPLEQFGRLDWNWIYGMGAGLFAALVALVGKPLTNATSNTVILFYGHAVPLFLVGIVFLALGWPFPAVSTSDAGYLFLMAVCSTCGYYALLKALQMASATVVSSFEYTRLIFAAAFGWALFGQIPNLNQIAGTCVIVGASVALMRLKK